MKTETLRMSVCVSTSLNSSRVDARREMMLYLSSQLTTFSNNNNKIRIRIDTQRTSM